MSVPTARLAGVGVFVIAGLLLLAVGLFMIGDRHMAFARKFAIYTEFAKVPGLEPGTIVRVSGAKAGTVKEIEPPRRPADRFRVKLEIAESLHPLVRTDSIAAIETEGLVGGTFLSVGTGSERAATAPENSTIPSREMFTIAELVSQLGDTVRKINTAIDDLQGEAKVAITSVNSTVAEARELVKAVGDDVKSMASAGARITGDFAEISESIRNGKGTIGKLVKDDELYQRATAIAKNAEDIAGDVKRVVAEARKAIADFQSDEGPVQGVAVNIKQTLGDARQAMGALAENMEALKRNFFFRGFFNKRGFYALSDISPAEYRQGVLTHGGDRRMLRVWLHTDVVFESLPGTNGDERLTVGGRARLDSAISSYLDVINHAVVMIEGYSQQGTADEQYLRSRARAASARDHLIGRFHLSPENTGLMPLGSSSPGSPQNAAWDGVAVAVFLDKERAANSK